MTHQSRKEDAHGRFGHHPDPAVDYCIEVEELQSIAENARLGLTGYGHEADRATLDARIDEALAFRVGADLQAIAARGLLRKLATERGFNLLSEVAYAGHPCPRLPVKDD